MNSKSKKKRNKIPLYPSKNKPINKKEKKPKIASILHHWKQPSTPSFTNSKKFSSSNNFNTIYCNSCNNNNTSKNKDNKGLQSNSSKQNLFHAFIPKSKSNTEVKLKKQKITLIKKINKSKFIPFNFKNIKEFNYKKDIKDHNFDINNNKNEYKNGINEKDTLSSYNSHNMNNTKANTNSNTTIGMSQLYSDRYSKDNNNKIMQELNNPMEFTFGNLNYFQTQNNKETKTTLISSNTLNMPFISIDNNKHFQSLDNNDSANKNMFMKNLIKNIKLINSKMKINNNKNSSEKSNDNNINNKNYNNIKSYSIEKDYYKKKEKKTITKILTLPIWPKANIDKKDFQMSCNEFHKSQKLSKKGSDLIY
jgi:hypothetical protein